MKRHIRQLTREFPEAIITPTRAGHFRIRVNGQVVFTSGTPSDRRAILNTRAKIKRQLRRAPS